MRLVRTSGILSLNADRDMRELDDEAESSDENRNVIGEPGLQRFENLF